MFRKIVSNLAFSPALVGQLGFYAKRLRKEESTRRIGLIFTALALVVQAFAVFTPPESANAANGDNIIYGGVKSKSDLLSIYDRNTDSAGHKDLQQIYSYFGITRQDIVNGSWTTFNSRDFNSTIQSVGRITYAWQRTPYAVTGTSTTVYGSYLYKFDSSSWTSKHGSMYYGVVGKRAVDGQWFAIMSACGNPAFIHLPPPPPQPSAFCSSLNITPITRTKFSFTAKSGVAHNATIRGYTYTIKDASGAVVATQHSPSNALSDTFNYTPTSERPAAKRTTPVVGKRTELARYTVAEGERIVYGQRIDGVVRVTDRPASPGGRCYLVERDLKSKDELDALVADYVAQARRMGAPPLATSPLDRYLDAVT